MALFVYKDKQHTFVPFSERGKEDAFTVTLKPLDARTLAKLEDGYVVFGGGNEAESVSLQQGSYNFKALKYGIVSWENLTDGEKEYPVKKNAKGEVLDECLALLPSSIVTEIANVIVAISKFPENAEVILGNVEKTEESVKSSKATKKSKSDD